MRLFHWRDEGEAIRPGLNIYPLASPYNLGGYLVIGALRIYLRWSKKRKRLHRAVSWVPAQRRGLPRSAW